MTRLYRVTVLAFDMSPEAAETLFDRVADAAHDLNEDVACTGGYVEDDVLDG